MASGGSDHLPARPAPGELPGPPAPARAGCADLERELDDARRRLADCEHRAARARELAVALQRAVRAPDIRGAVVGGLDIAARCAPAQAGFLVAGDWCDVLALPGGDALLVVGDIAGHGIDAVAGMVAARNALRALAAGGAEPGPLVAALNRAACLLPEEITGTVVVARYAPGRRELRWARAGHLPFVLVRGGAAQVQPMPEGMLLGVHPGGRYEQRVLSLHRADTLLFFTDGLVERRSGSISDALAGFAAAAGRAPVPADLDEHVARLLAGAVADTGDDACLLAVRVRE